MWAKKAAPAPACKLASQLAGRREQRDPSSLKGHLPEDSFTTFAFTEAREEEKKLGGIVGASGKGGFYEALCSIVMGS